VKIDPVFWRAVSTSNLYDAERLLKKGTIDVTASDNGAFHLAVTRTDHSMMELLLKNGADATSRNGRALTTAAENKDARSIEILVPYFSAPQWGDVCNTCLLNLVNTGHLSGEQDCVKHLAPLCSQQACNAALVCALRKQHSEAVVDLLYPRVDATAVLILWEKAQQEDFFFTPSPDQDKQIERLKILETAQQRQRIEQDLPQLSKTTVTRKI